MRLCWCLSACFEVCVQSVNGQIHSKAPLEYFCQRYGYGSTKEGDSIFAYGGRRDPTSYNGTDSYANSLVRFDLFNSWDALRGVRPNLYTISNGSEEGSPASRVGNAIFYYKRDDIHVYGGALAPRRNATGELQGTTPAENILWTLSPNTGQWTSHRGDFAESRYVPMYGAYAHAPEHDLAFYLNGLIKNGTDEQPSLEMRVIDLKTKFIRTVSTSSISSSIARVGAVLQYLPNVGSKGGLALLGGRTMNDTTISEGLRTMATLDSIHILDIASLDSTENGVWYEQQTSGRAPVGRDSFCAVTILSPDNSQYHIYINSGYNSTNPIDDIYILSLPQFRWTKVFAGERANYGTQCHVVGNKQMLVLGGIDDHNCDESPYIALFDMTNLKWVRTFVHQSLDKEFRVPRAVWSMIGGSAFGDSNMTEPEGGWVNEGLGKMFEGLKKNRGSVTVDGNKSQGSRLETRFMPACFAALVGVSFWLLM